MRSVQNQTILNILGNYFYIFLLHLFIIYFNSLKKLTHFSKNPAIFELLEDDEHYAVYDHNPNEANWNVFYKTLPPVSDFSFFLYYLNKYNQ
jgi:hypothetical protein